MNGKRRKRKIWRIEDISFNEDLIAECLTSFYHFGINHEDKYKEIKIIERALNDIHRKLCSALKGDTHRHKRNMAFGYKKMIRRLELSLIHEGGSYQSEYYNNCIVELYQNQLDSLLKQFQPIFDIITFEEFSHRDHDLLLRPYLFDFEYNGVLNESYIEIREKVEKLLIKKLKPILLTKPDLKKILKNKNHLQFIQKRIESYEVES